MAVVQGAITINEIVLAEVDTDPSTGLGLSAPIGSVSFLGDQVAGTVWLKTGAGDTAWSLFPRLANATPFTGGSVIFSDANGFLSQDNADLYWDNANTRLGIGMNSPTKTLQVATSTASSDNGITVDAYGANAGAVAIRRANGTAASPTAVTSGQVMAQFDAFGYGTSQFNATETASMAFVAAETFTNTAMGTHIAFYTTPTGSTTESERVRIHSSGRVLVNTTTDDGATQLQVSGRISASDAIRPGNSTNTTNGNIRFNGLGLEFYRGGSWRDLSFPKYNYDDFTWATLGAGGNPFDFASATGTGGTVTVEGAATGNNYAGLIAIATGTTNNATGTAALSGFNSVNKIILGGLPTTIEWRVLIPALSANPATFEARLGLQDTNTTGDPANGVYFVYSNTINGGQWQAITRSSSTSTTVNSAVTVAINTWYRLRAEINAAGTNVDFYIDSGSGYSLIGSSTTNIPTTGLRPVAKVNKTSNTATSRIMNVDWCWWVLER